MMIYRSLVVGLLGAIALLLVEQGALLERAARAPAIVAAPMAPASPLGIDDDGPTLIVHISKRRAGDDPRAALGIGARARVIALDDRPLRPAWGLDVLRARWRAAQPGSYFELVLAGDDVRRMLVLVMP